MKCLEALQHKLTNTERSGCVRNNSVLYRGKVLKGGEVLCIDIKIRGTSKNAEKTVFLGSDLVRKLPPFHKTTPLREIEPLYELRYEPLKEQELV